jgi:hypothetical protein
MKGTTGLWTAAALAAAAVGVLVGFSGRTGAQVPGEVPTAEANLPVTGITRGETALVHVAHLPSDPAAGGAPVNVRVQYFDATGRLIKEDQHDVEPNTFITSSLTASDFGAAAPRMEFRAVVEAQGAPCPGPPSPGTDAGAPSGEGHVSVSMEIVNGRGTVLTLTGPDVVVALAPPCAPPTADGGVP